jgi:hypothetical protein
MKTYTLTINFQVEDPENSGELAKITEHVESGEAKARLSMGDIEVTDIKLEENENN